MRTASLADGRNELKFVAPQVMLPHVRTWLMLHRAGFSVAYPSRRINSLYFDNWDQSGLEENLSGASRRTKLRYRWYGPAEPLNRGQLEVKLKRNKLGKKLTFDVATAPSGSKWREILASLRRSLPDDGRIWLDSQLQPMLLVSYVRAYLVDASGQVRVTLDSDVCYFDQRYSRKLDLRRKANVESELVIEVKCARDDLGFARDCMARFPVRLSRNSKYSIGTAAARGY